MIWLAQPSGIAPLVVMIALTIRGSAQVIPAGVAPPGPRTGMIVGRVVDAATGSRRIRMTRPATDGAFSVTGLPPGEYYLAALADLETGEWNDPMLLEELVKSSAKVTLRDSEETKQDFRIGG